MNKKEKEKKIEELETVIKENLDILVTINKKDEGFITCIKELRSVIDEYSSLAKKEFPSKIKGYSVDKGNKNFYVKHEGNLKLIRIPRRYIDVFDKYSD